MSLKRQQFFSFLYFVSPALLLVSVFVIYPILKTIWLSFLSPQGDFVGLSNYWYLLTSSDIINHSRFPTKSPPWGALIHNIVWIGIHLPLTVGLGLFFAIILTAEEKNEPRSLIIIKSVIKSVIFLGMVMPMVVGGLLAIFLFDKDIGIVNLILRALGISFLADISWVAHPETALLATILSGVWMWTGFSMIVYSAGLTTIPKEYYEAAEIDGANLFQRFRYITLPLLKPATLVVVVMSVLYELKIFDIIFVATRGGPGASSMVLALLMYLYGFVYFEVNVSSALAVLLTLLTLPPAIWIAKTAVGRK
ncbi:MAG: sugar ABC transporter permease [Candidatus Odinarchaeota archaeon]|nr:sugar ABC transporter permease [Candidatus Odinarchaeota archaeon]